MRCVGRDTGTLHGKESKRDALREIGAVAFLDDYPDYAEQAADVLPLSVFLHNGYADIPETGHRVTVIDHPMDFPVLVESFLRRTGKVAPGGAVVGEVAPCKGAV